jgi:hypothetical protein
MVYVAETSELKGLEVKGIKILPKFQNSHPAFYIDLNIVAVFFT